jgi:hypothetical protein
MSNTNQVRPYSHGGGFAVGCNETHITSITDVRFIFARYK